MSFARRFLQGCFLFALILFVLPVSAEKATLKNLIVHSKTHRWQFTFTFSKPIQYRGFFLDHPTRYVLDLKNVKPTIRLSYKPVLGTPIRRMRYSPHPDNIFRIVFDLDKHVKAKLVTAPTDQQGERLQLIFHQKKIGVVGFSWPFKRAKSAAEKHLKKLKPLKTKIAQKTATVFEKKKQKKRDVVIVIDPGHGGRDPGATGRAGTHEKDVVLSISKYLAFWINQQPGFHAVLTRRGDYYLRLRQRLDIARRDKADMFIAIHADAWKNRSAHGVSVFALSRRGATSEAARWLAVRENKSELMGGVDLQDKSHLLKSVLLNLSQTATIRSSLKIGADVIRSVQRITQLHHGRVEQAAFVVLKSPDIPSLLVETGFISNPREERNLRRRSYQKKLAHAIMQGVRQYFKGHPPRNTWLAYWRKHPRNKLAQSAYTVK